MICVYPADCTDFSTNSNGTLAPLSAEVTETLNGEYELTLVHPIDEAGKWQRLVEGCIKSSGGKVNIRTDNGTSYSRITAVAPGTTLEYVASAFNGWQAVKIGSQVGWVSGEYSEITTE